MDFRKHFRLLKQLHEGERAFGAYYYSATAKHYHGVDGSDGPLESVGPMLENDSRLIERHLKRLSAGSPVTVVVQDLLEASKRKASTTILSPHAKMLNRLAKTSPFEVHIGKR